MANKSNTELPSNLNLLAIRDVEYWEEYNEYEGHCIALWHGREDCFHLCLNGDEWDAVQPNKEWSAHLEFECGKEIEILTNSTGLSPMLAQLKGVNYRISGQIIHRDGNHVWLDLPWPLLVDLDLPASAMSSHIQVGCWLTATGTLEARVPD